LLAIFQKIKELFSPQAKGGQPLWEQDQDNIEREMRYFKDTFRIGILCQYTTDAAHDLILKYKKELDILGYETEVLMFVNDKEMPRTVFLPNFTLKDINKQGIPYNPRIDRFVKKKFDMMFNLYFENHAHLLNICQRSVAKCRVGALRPDLKANTDLFVYTDAENSLQLLIEKINETLQKQAYARKHL
jgi:hypothetical protein